jgi:hypothetical protein
MSYDYRTIFIRCYIFIIPFSLDFVSFTTAQPTLGTCTDSFMVGGATTIAPIICGDNSGQHSNKEQNILKNRPRLN